MEDIYNSPFTYGPGPYYIPDHNPNYIQAPEHIHPDSVAGQLGLTLEELTPIERKHREFLHDRFAQPPTQSTTYHHNRYTPTEPPPPPPDSASPTLSQSIADLIAHLGITPAKLEEMEQDSDREQRLFAIKYEAEQTTRRDRDWRGEPKRGLERNQRRQ
jgi:hypothetical protein